MGDTRFLTSSKNLINTFVNNFVKRLEKSDSKEVSIYLLYSTASTLTRQLRGEREKEKDGGGEGAVVGGGGIYDGEVGRVEAIRKVCEELLHTILPRTQTSSGLVSSLLTEVLTLQISKVAEGIDADYLNMRIVEVLGEGAGIDEKVKEKVEEEKDKKKDKEKEKEGEKEQGEANKRESEELPVVHKSTAISTATATTTMATQPPPPILDSKAQVEEPEEEEEEVWINLSEEVRVLRKQKKVKKPSTSSTSNPPPNSNPTSPTKKRPNRQSSLRLPPNLMELISIFIHSSSWNDRELVVSKFDITLLAQCTSPPQSWHPELLGSEERKLVAILERKDETLSDAFQAFVEASKARSGGGVKGGESYGYLNLWNQLESFRSVVGITKPGADVLRDDAISVLRRSVEGEEVKGKLKEGGDGEFEGALKEVMGRIVLFPNEDIFVPLQRWIFNQLLKLHRSELSEARSPYLENPPNTVNAQDKEKRGFFSTPLSKGVSLPIGGNNLSSGTVGGVKAEGGTHGDQISGGLTKRWSEGNWKYSTYQSSHHHQPRSPSVPMIPSTSTASQIIKEAAVEGEDGEGDLGEISLEVNGHADGNGSGGETKEREITNGERWDEEENMHGSGKGVIKKIESAEDSSSHLPPVSSSKSSTHIDLPPAQLRPNSSGVSVDVTVTDISPATAYQGETVKNQKLLTFLVAIESSDTTIANFIIQRSWPEIEKLDQQLSKALPEAGTTVEFPRALLPSTNYKNREQVTNNIEVYFKHLLEDKRYSESKPVKEFFEKDRTLSGGNQGIAMGIGNAVEDGVKDLIGGVSKQFAIGQNLASKGFGTLKKGIGFRKTSVTERPSGVTSTLNGVNPKGSQIMIKDNSTGPGNSVGTNSQSIRDSISQERGSSSTSSTPAAVTNILATNSRDSESTETRGYSIPDSKSQIQSITTSTPEFSRRSISSPPSTNSNLSEEPIQISAMQVPYKIRTPKSTLIKVNQQANLGKIREVPQEDNIRHSGYAKLGQEEGEEDESNKENKEEEKPITKTLNEVFELTINQPSPSFNGSGSEDSSNDKMGENVTSSPQLEVPRSFSNSVNPSPSGSPMLKPVPSAPSVPITTNPSPKVKDSKTLRPQSTSLSQKDLDAIIVSVMSVVEESYDLSSRPFSFKKGVLRTFELLLKSNAYSGMIKNFFEKSIIDRWSDTKNLSIMIEGMIENFWPGGLWWATAVLEGKIPKPVERTKEEKEKTREEARKLFINCAPQAISLALGGNSTNVALGRVFDLLQNEGVAVSLATAVLLDVLRVLLL